MVEVTIYMTQNDKESYQKSTVHRKNERFVTICPNIKNIYTYIYRSHKSIVHFFLVSDFCWKECSHSFDTAHTHIGLGSLWCDMSICFYFRVRYEYRSVPLL